MKKFTKGVLITCLVCTVVGIVFCVIGGTVGVGSGGKNWIARYDAHGILTDPFRMLFGITGAEKTDEESVQIVSDDSSDDTSDESDSNYSIEGIDGEKKQFDSVDSLSIDLDYGTFIIKEDSSLKEGTVSVILKKNDHEISVENNDGELEITEDYDKISKRLKKAAQITLLIPENMQFDSVDIMTDAGVIKIMAPIQTDDFDLEVDAGTVDITGTITADTVSMDVDAGTLNVGTIKAKDSADFSVDAGKIALGTVSTGSLDMDVSMGKISVSDVKSIKEADINCDMGKIDVNVSGKASDYRYDISCDMGTVKVGDKTYSGLGREKELNSDQTNAPLYSLSCGVGTIKLSFE